MTTSSRVLLIVFVDLFLSKGGWLLDKGTDLLDKGEIFLDKGRIFLDKGEILLHKEADVPQLSMPPGQKSGTSQI